MKKSAIFTTSLSEFIRLRNISIIKRMAAADVSIANIELFHSSFL